MPEVTATTTTTMRNNKTSSELECNRTQLPRTAPPCTASHLISLRPVLDISSLPSSHALDSRALPHYTAIAVRYKVRFPNPSNSGVV